MACSDEIESLADAAHEAVISVTAADVSYGDDSDVQAALDELVASNTAHNAQLSEMLQRLEALEGRVDGHDTALAANTVEHATLAGTIAAVELAQPDHTAELAQLTGAIAEQKAAAETLADKLSSPVDCPVGSAKSFTTCIDEEVRPATPWRIAHDDCAVVGAHVCTAQEYLGGCLNLNGGSATTMTSDILSVDTILTVTMNVTVGCVMALGEAPLKGADLPYRCCWDLGRDWAVTPQDP